MIRRLLVVMALLAICYGSNVGGVGGATDRVLAGLRYHAEHALGRVKDWAGDIWTLRDDTIAAADWRPPLRTVTPAEQPALGALSARAGLAYPRGHGGMSEMNQIEQAARRQVLDAATAGQVERGDDGAADGLLSDGVLPVAATGRAEVTA